MGLSFRHGSTDTGFLKSTSPLRRRIDLWNQALLLWLLGALDLEPSSWVESVVPRLPEWDKRSHVCSKLQRNMALLRWAASSSNELLVGRVVELGSSTDVLVYMESLRILLWCQAEDALEGGRGHFRLYYFELASHVKKKVRIEWVKWI